MKPLFAKIGIYSLIESFIEILCIGSRVSLYSTSPKRNIWQTYNTTSQARLTAIQSSDLMQMSPFYLHLSVCVCVCVCVCVSIHVRARLCTAAVNHTMILLLTYCQKVNSSLTGYNNACIIRLTSSHCTGILSSHVITRRVRTVQ